MLWLDEPRLHDPSLYLPSLPPPYDPARLETLLKPELVCSDTCTRVATVRKSQGNTDFFGEFTSTKENSKATSKSVKN